VSTVPGRCADRQTRLATGFINGEKIEVYGCSSRCSRYLSRLRRSIASIRRFNWEHLWRSFRPAIKLVTGAPVFGCAVRAAERRKMISLGREPQEKGVVKKN